MRTLHVLAVSAALAACSSHPASTPLPADEAKSLLIDRNWLDVYPTSSKDRLHVYRFVPNMGGGVYQDRTLFKGTFELFSFTATGSEIQFTLHETEDKVTSPYTIEPVDGPAPFDLKLTIPGDPRGPKIYYGIKSETDSNGQALEQRLHDVAAH